jgi:hypothetical protein
MICGLWTWLRRRFGRHAQPMRVEPDLNVDLDDDDYVDDGTV